MAPKILWLCSWYPNDSDPYDGDFIQRQAEAVSTLSKIDVVHIYKHIGKKPLAEYQKNERSPHLTEHIFANHVKSESLFQTIKGWINFIRIHIKFLKSYGKPDLIHVQVPMKAGIIAMIYKWIYGVPYVLTEHYGIYNEFTEDQYKTRNIFFRIATKLIIKNADQLTTVSKSLGEDINQVVLKKNFIIIPNVVDTNHFCYEPSVKKNRFQFIHISNMAPIKNVRGIIEACEILYRERKDFSMVFVGKIDEGCYQMASALKLLPELISFEGEIPYLEVSKKMKESDALIIFSDMESQSCVVLESLCCGRPCIVTNVGGVKELIQEDNGYQVNPGEPQQLVAKMKQMMDNYSSFDLYQISRKASMKYAYESVAKKFVEVYDQVL